MSTLAQRSLNANSSTVEYLCRNHYDPLVIFLTQGSFWPSENLVKTDLSKEYRARQAVKKSLPEPPSIQATLFSSDFH